MILKQSVIRTGKCRTQQRIWYLRSYIIWVKKVPCYEQIDSSSGGRLCTNINLNICKMLAYACYTFRNEIASFYMINLFQLLPTYQFCLRGNDARYGFVPSIWISNLRKGMLQDLILNQTYLIHVKTIKGNINV